MSSSYRESENAQGHSLGADLVGSTCQLSDGELAGWMAGALVRWLGQLT